MPASVATVVRVLPVVVNEKNMLRRLQAVQIIRNERLCRNSLWPYRFISRLVVNSVTVASFGKQYFI